MMRRIATSSAATSLLAANARFASAGATVDTAAIAKAVKARKVFDPAVVDAAVAEFANIGFGTTYPEHFGAAEMGEHVFGLLCARAKVAAGGPLSYNFEKGTSAFYFCGAGHECQQQTLAAIERFIKNQYAALGSKDKDGSKSHGVSVRSFHSTSGDVVLFTVTVSPFVNAEPQPAELANVSVVGSATFQQRRTEVKERYAEVLARLQTSVTPTFSVAPLPAGGGHAVTLALHADRTTYFPALMALLSEIPGATITKKFMETFAGGAHVYTFYVNGATAKQLEEKATLIGLLPNRPNNAITKLHESRVFTAEETIFAHALIIFAFYFTKLPVDDNYKFIKDVVGKESNGLNRLDALRNSLSQEMMSERYIGTLIGEYPEHVKKIFADFVSGASSEQSRTKLDEEITTLMAKEGRDPHDIEIMKTFITFNKAVKKHNFFKPNKAALAFRLDPAVFIGNRNFPRVPHGIFLFVGGLWRGFHVRFTDIARGGVRLIVSKTNSLYKKNKQTVFQENYNLANTQLLKNKDIPEGGSKGTILVSNRYLNEFQEGKCKVLFLQYVDALLDLIVPGTEGVVDKLGQPEIIFLGPDENTAGSFPAAGALYSKGRGYSAWKSFTTGKDPILGGIPHDTYGMTTRSVRVNVEGLYEKLGLDETKLTKFQTGGPDGDLGSNEILRSKETYMAIVDGSGVLHDPAGLNREELVRLAKARKTVAHFDVTKLSKDGFLVIASPDNKDVRLPDGTFVEDTMEFRNTFHFTKYANADVFVPCGGRPRSVTLSNVAKFVRMPDITGEKMLKGDLDKINRDALKFKVIVEGANLFISQDARLALERCGVSLIKDATANKGGVTSSSLEVLTGLALTDAEHGKLMAAKDEHDAPQFYKDLVKEICTRIESNARREFDTIWREHEARPKLTLTEISDQVSEKIFVIRTHLLHSNLFENPKFIKYILQRYTPATLLSAVTVEQMNERVPINYQKAICAMWLASDYVYTVGPRGTEYDFFEFMRAHFDRFRGVA